MDTPDNALCITIKRDGVITFGKVIKLGIGTQLQEQNLLENYLAELKDLI